MQIWRVDVKDKIIILMGQSFFLSWICYKTCNPKECAFEGMEIKYKFLLTDFNKEFKAMPLV